MPQWNYSYVDKLITRNETPVYACMQKNLQCMHFIIYKETKLTNQISKKSKKKKLPKKKLDRNSKYLFL